MSNLLPERGWHQECMFQDQPSACEGYGVLCAVVSSRAKRIFVSLAKIFWHSLAGGLACETNFGSPQQSCDHDVACLEHGTHAQCVLISCDLVYLLRHIIERKC